jgi:ectoine hydroxylase-related dioxygenase (phytanoyl-CoA dioxygenase family)
MAKEQLVYDHEGNKSLKLDVQLKDIRKILPLRALSAADWQHWITWGYVVIPNAVPPEHVEKLKTLLWEFQEMDPEESATWNRAQLRDHQMTELNNSGMVEIYNHQLLWDSRQNPRVYNAFVDIWDREDLWVTIDRANLNTPNRDGRPFGGFIHWDSDTSLVCLPINVQGVLSLVDTDPEVGGFQCVPELFRTLEQWIRTQPRGRNPFRPDLTGFEVKFVPTKAGDLLIFNTLLAHGIRPNTSKDRARLAQYISMYPADEENAQAIEARIRMWRDREAPAGVAFPGDPREWEKTRYAQAELSPLGRRLLGLEPWNSQSTGDKSAGAGV